MPEIIVKLGERIIHRYAFDKEMLSVGRARDNDIVIENLSVSRNHARIKKQDGKFFLTDMNSANGTLVNGVRVSKAEITHNDQLTVGKHTLVFLDSSEEGAISPDARGPAITPAMPQKFVGLVGILVVTKGKQAGQEFRITKKETSIGRASENDIRLHDWFVSKKHAAIIREGDEYFLKDLDSWRGTTVNGATIREVQLKQDDEIVFGTTVLSFRAVDGEELARMPAPVREPEGLSEFELEWDAQLTGGKPDAKPPSGRGKRVATPPPEPPHSQTPDIAEPLPPIDAQAGAEVASADSIDAINLGDIVVEDAPAAPAPPDSAQHDDATPLYQPAFQAAPAEDEFAPMTEEELEALEAEADIHVGTKVEEEASRRASWDLAEAEKMFERRDSSEQFSLIDDHEELQRDEEALIDEKKALNGLHQRTAASGESDKAQEKESAEEEKELFGGPIPARESGVMKKPAASHARTPIPGAEATSPSDTVKKEIAMWEKALQNKSMVIRKNAAKELKKLTGKEYDWKSEPAGA